MHTIASALPYFVVAIPLLVACLVLLAIALVPSKVDTMRRIAIRANSAHARAYGLSEGVIRMPRATDSATGTLCTVKGHKF